MKHFETDFFTKNNALDVPSGCQMYLIVHSFFTGEWYFLIQMYQSSPKEGCLFVLRHFLL